MNTRYLSLFILLSLLPALRGQEVYLDMNGLVVMEIESTPVFGGWKMENAIPGYLGDGYYYWSGNFTAQPDVHTLKYRFKVAQAGTYRLAIRNQNSNSDVTLDNDVFATIDDGTFHKLYSHGGASWSFGSTLEVGGQHVPPDYPLAAGEHVLKISARSSNFRLDRIHIWDTSRWSNEEAHNIFHSESPVENGSGVVEATARIFLTSRTNRIPFTVDCDASLSNGAENSPISLYSWRDDEDEQQSISSSPLKTFAFFTPGEHTIHLQITDSEGNTSGKSVTISGVQRTLGSIAPASASASRTFANQTASRTIDEDLGTTWTSPRTGEYIQYDFLRTVTVESLDIMFKSRDTATYRFDVLASDDGETFTPLLEDAQTSSNDEDFDSYTLPANRLRFLRIFVRDTSTPGFVNLREVVFNGFYPPLSPLEAWKTRAIDYGDGVLGFPWFGWFWPMGDGWFYHLQHGWTFGMGQSEDDMLLWQPALGWFRTGSSLYPFLYLYDNDTWYWFYEATSAPERWFYDLGTEAWIGEGL